MNKLTVAIVGLGYVGLPLAVHLSKHYTTIGIDINKQKIDELKTGIDKMAEASTEELKASPIQYESDFNRLKEADIIIAAIPTPVDDHNVPDLDLVKKASAAIGKHMKKGAIVSFESTVWPGVTEDICVPILEKESGFVYNKEFFVGYSPERVNPGDKEHTIDKIKKVVSGSTPETTKTLAAVYGSFVTAGIHIAPSLKVAEAAKVIENVQRDINIALVNELAMLFDRMDINVHDVLDAAGTKWNFIRYTPGLVGGHCIGVDPYYLTYKAIEYNYHPNIILAGRRINDRMHSFYVNKLVRKLNMHGIPTNKAKVVILGLTFKENCTDYRNSRVEHLIKELKGYGCTIYGIDPWLDDSVIAHFGVTPKKLADLNSLHADAVVIAVPHHQFINLDLSVIPVKVDIKGKMLRYE